MNESFRICAIGIVFAIVCILIKNFRNEFLVPVRVGSVILIFSLSLAMLVPILSFIGGIVDKLGANEYIEVMLKALAIAYITNISSDICKDCGEGSIATGIEIAGKIEMILISLPLINKIIMVSQELISW